MDLSGDFTVECWAYFNEIKNMMFASKWGSNQYGWTLFYESGLKFYSGNDASDYSTGTTTSFNKTVTVGQWYHIAVARTGNTLSTFINGVRTATATTTDSNTANTPTYIGTNGSSSSGIANYGILGYLSDVRIIKGTAAYNGTTYTVPTAPLTAITNTKLLLNMADGQAIDSAAQNNLTLYGNANTSTDQAKFGDTSLQLDGTGDYATFLHSPTNDISGAGDWTVELFWRSDDVAHNNVHEIVSKDYGFQILGDARGSLNGNIAIGLSANNNSTYFMSGSGSALSNNTWYHIAVVKYGTSYKLYLDGTADISATSSSNVSTGTNPWTLGAFYDGSLASRGYIDDFRISKFARYTGNFTAPSEPFADKGQ
jgi:hypothetical protein